VKNRIAAPEDVKPLVEVGEGDAVDHGKEDKEGKFGVN